MPETTSDEKATYKVGEVCRLAGIQPYVLRYWESEFPDLASGKGTGGTRNYTRTEVDLVCRIKALLYEEGYTIAGARRKLESEPVSASAPVGAAAGGGDGEAGAVAEAPAAPPPHRPKPRRAREERAAPAATIDSFGSSGLNAPAAELEAIADELDEIVGRLK